MTTTPLLHDKLAWDGKRLVVTKPELIDSKLRRSALSASTSKSMQSCAARWVGERLLRSDIEDPFEPAPLGTSAHSILEDLFDVESFAPAERTMTTAASLVERDAAIKWPDNPKESDAVRAAVKIAKARWIEEVRLAYEGLFVIENPAEIDVWGRETQINGLEINGVPTNGFIDRIRTGTNKESGKSGLIVEDYKTGKVLNTRFGDDHGDQIRIYAEAIRVKTGEMPVGGTVLYTKFGKSREIDLRPAAMKKTLKTFELSWKRHNSYMKTQDFPTKVSALCGWCPLVNSCPVAKDEGKAVSEKVADRIHSAVELGIPVLRAGARPERTASDPGLGDGTELVFFAPDDAEISAAVAAQVEREAADAAHMYDSGENPTKHSVKDGTMTESNIITEAKPWVETTPEGEINPGAYKVTAAFGLAELAAEALFKADLPLTKSNVSGLAFTFYYVVSRAQKSWTGSVSLQDSANTRLRGALRTVIETLPLPLGKDIEAWNEWVDAAVKRTKAISAVAMTILTEKPNPRPWEVLAVEAPVEEAPAPAPAPEEAPARPVAVKDLPAEEDFVPPAFVEDPFAA
jgi:putative RecB family exonuclease